MITMGGFSLPSRTIREMICASVDVIVQAARLRDGSRRITHITEVLGMEGDVIITQDLFVYEMLGEDAQGKLIGRHRSTGIGRPRFWERARYYGEEKRLAAALDAAEVASARLQLSEAAMPMQTDRHVLPGRASRSAASPGCSSIRCCPASGRPRSAWRASRKPERGARKAATARRQPSSRREQVEETLKELETRRKKQKSPPLSVRIAQAGLTWSKQQFMIGSRRARASWRSSSCS